jgi:hypothetical protein
MSRRSLRETASAVEWTSVQQYLLSRGWQKTASRRDEIGVFRHNGTEVVVPLDRSLDDYDEAIVAAADKIAHAEKRDPAAVLDDLLYPHHDIMRFARTGEDNADGTLALDDGPAFLDASRRALVSAAHSVERPHLRFHRRLAMKLPEEFAGLCRIGQTEHGSFVLRVFCPLNVPGDRAKERPFGRRTVERLMTSVAATVNIVRRDGMQRVIDTGEREEPVITSNLCQALVEMMPPDESSDLRLGATWSPVVAALSIPSEVQVDRDLFPVFEDLGAKLRPPSAPVPDYYMGRVIDLHAEDNELGELEGDVTLSMLVDDEPVRARCSLGPRDYQQAVEAHKQQIYLRLYGTLKRRPKLSVIEEVSQVRVFSLAKLP